jgi:hypothetical protein
VARAYIKTFGSNTAYVTTDLGTLKLLKQHTKETNTRKMVVAKRIKEKHYALRWSLIGNQNLWTLL